MPHWSLSRSAASAQLMIRLAAEYGVSLESCVAGTGLSGDEVVDPSCEIAGEQELAVLRNILRALDPSVGFALQAGLRYRATTHGMWGFALMTSSSFREALEVAMRYFDLSFSFNRVSFELEGQRLRLIYDGDENPEDLRAALIERDLAALLAMQLEIVGTAVPVLALQFQGRRPVYAAEFEPLFGVKPQWNAERNCIDIDAAVLATSSRHADARGARVCEEQCRALLERRGTRSGLAGRVRGRMLRDPSDFPSMEAVAAELGMTTRTLRNQLRREGTSYRQVVDGARETVAAELLSRTRMTIEEIAERVGYADTSSFISAFKRWKGVPPRSFRERPAQPGPSSSRS